MPPLRTIVAFAIVLTLAVLAVWAAVALPRSRSLPLSRPLRAALTVIVVAVLSAAVAWLVFVLPAYWD